MSENQLNNSAKSLKKRGGFQKHERQIGLQTQIMDDFTQQVFGLEDKSAILQEIKLQIQEHGEVLLNSRDSAGNSLIHNVCLSFDEKDEESFAEVLTYLLGTADQEQLEIQACMNFLAFIPLEEAQEQKVLSEIGIKPSEQHIQLVNINTCNAFNQTPLHLLASQRKVKLLVRFLEISLAAGDFTELNLKAVNSSKATFLDTLLQKELLDTYERVFNICLDHAVSKGSNSEARNKIIDYMAYLCDLLSHGKEPQSYEQWFEEMKVTEEEIDIYGHSQLPEIFKRSIRAYFTAFNRKLDKMIVQAKYKEYADVLIESSMISICSLSGLLRHHHTKTNILHTLANKATESNFFQLLEQLLRVGKKWRLDLSGLANDPTTDGSSLSFKVLGSFSFEGITRFIGTVGIHDLHYCWNEGNKRTLMHEVCGNARLTAGQVAEIARQFIDKVDKNGTHLMKMVDKSGNLPVNYLISRLGTKASQAEVDSVEVLLRMSENQQSSHLESDYEAFLVAFDEIKQQRKELSKKPDRYKKMDKNEIGKIILDKDEAQINRKNRKEKYAKLCSIVNVPTSPLECAVRANNVPLAKLLIDHFASSALVFSSNPLTYIIELAAHNEQLFKLCASAHSIIVGENILLMILRLFRKLEPTQGNLQSYTSLVDAIVNPKHCDLLQSVEALAPNTLKDLLVALRKSGKGDQADHIVQILVLSARDQNWLLFKKLMPYLKFAEDDHYFPYRLLKDQCYLNHKLGVSHVIDLYPKIVEIVNGAPEKKSKLSKAIFVKFRDIVDLDLVENLAQKFNITLIPKIESDVLHQRKSERGQRFQRLAVKDQRQLISQQQGLAFKFIVNLLKTNRDLADLQGIAEVLLKSKSKHKYLSQLVKEQVLFQMIDIRLEVHQKSLGQLLSTAAKHGDLQLFSQILTQLKSYLTSTCSSYPLNFYAELSQFYRNYPYREFQFNSFIRIINHSKDEYPIYMGKHDTGLVDDEVEQQLSDSWEELLKSNAKIQVTNEKGEQDYLVPNGHAVMFRAFLSQGTIQITLDDKNIQVAETIFSQILDLGGFPFVEISNIRECKSDRQKRLLKLSNLIQKFRQSIKQKSFQTILHQMSIDQQFDTQLLKSLCDSQSLQHQNLNSKDSMDRTPISLAILRKNMAFLEIAMTHSKYLFIDQDPYSRHVLSEFFSDSTVGQQFLLLKLIAANAKNSSDRIQQLMVKENSKAVYDFIDLLYKQKIDEEQQINEWMRQLNYQLLQKGKLFIETYKLQRTISMQKKDITQQIVFGRQMSPSMLLGHYIHQIGSEITLAQLKELESLGYRLCNSICPAIFNSKLLHNKVFILPQNFPFKDQHYQLSYTLKYVILKQPKNLELINYMISQMDKALWKPFLFEVMVFFGKIVGTKNDIFKRLFSDEKAYMMGKMLTVENRLKSYTDSFMPVMGNPFYEDDQYRALLGELAEILVTNGESQMLQKLMSDLGRFFLCKELTKRGLEACCRNFKPRMALIFAAYGLDQEIIVKDVASIMPNLEAQVTLSDIEETAILSRCVQNWKRTSFLKKITREMMDEFVLLLIETKSLAQVINVNPPEPYEKDDIDALVLLYSKCSPTVIGRLLPILKGMCESDKSRSRLIKLMVSMPNRLLKSITQSSFSSVHSNQRRAEMNKYLNSKAETFAREKLYTDIILDQKRTQDTADLLGITMQDMKDYQLKIGQIKAEQDKIVGKTFVFGEYQSLIGVFKNTDKSGRPNRNEFDQVSDMQNYSEKEVREMTKEDLKNKSESLILLYEKLMKQDAKKNSNQVVTFPNKAPSIQDKELREIVTRSQPQSINLAGLFGTNHSIMFNNDLESALNEQKFQHVMDLIDYKTLTKKAAYNLMTKMKQTQTYSFSSLDSMRAWQYKAFIKMLGVYEQMAFKDIKTQVFQNDDERQAELEILIAHRSEFLEYAVKSLKNKKAQPQRFKDCLVIVSSLLHLDAVIQYQPKRLLQQPEAFSQILQINGFNEDSIDRLFGFLRSQLLMDDDVYNHVKSSFLVPILENKGGLFDFSKRDEFNQLQAGLGGSNKHHLYSLFICVFQHDDEEMQKKVLHHKDFMQLASYEFKQLVFMILASKPASNHKADQVLLLLKEYMAEVDIIGEGIPNNLRKYKIRYTPPRMRISHFDQNFQLQDPVSYLFRCGRPHVGKEYLNGREMSIQNFIAILKFAHKDKKTLTWLLKEHRDVCNPEEQPRLFSWLLTNVDLEALIAVDDAYGNRLLDTEIAYQESEDETAKFYSIVNNLILGGQYEKVAALQDFAKGEQWEKLAFLKKPFDEIDPNQGADEEDQGEQQPPRPVVHSYLPFILAMKSGQFDLCKILVPGKEQVPLLSETDLEYIQKFIADPSIFDFHVKNRDVSAKLAELNNAVSNIGNFKQRSFSSFHLSAKLIAVPEVFQIIEYLEIEEKEKRLKDIQKQVRQEYGLFEDLKEGLKKLALPDTKLDRGIKIPNDDPDADAPQVPVEENKEEEVENNNGINDE